MVRRDRGGSGGSGGSGGRCGGVPRPGFGIVEVIVALVIFAVGALGAAVLTAHAARVATDAERRETATRQVNMLLDSLAAIAAPGAGTWRDAVAHYHWSVSVDSAIRRISIVAIPDASNDTIRIDARRVALPPVIGAP